MSIMKVDYGDIGNNIDNVFFQEYTTLPTNGIFGIGFKPKRIIVWCTSYHGGANTLSLYDENRSTTNYYQFYGGARNDVPIGNTSNAGFQSIDDVGSQNNPEGGFTLTYYSWWGTSIYVAAWKEID